MEARIGRLVEEGDFYAAHQALLSHAQKLQRAGKLEECTEFLFRGIRVLCAGGAPTASIVDASRKLMQIVSQEGLILEEEMVVELLGDLLRLAEPHGDFWVEYAGFALALPKVERVRLFKLLLDSEATAIEMVVRLALKYCSDEASVFARLAKDPKMTVETLLSASLQLVGGRFFHSALTLAQNGGGEGATVVVGSLRLYPKDGPLAASSGVIARMQRVANLTMLLVELCRRRDPPKALFIQLQVRYADLLRDETARTSWDRLREQLWPAPRQSCPTNPLAMLMQSMMAGAPQP